MDFKELFIGKLIISLVLALIYTLIFWYIRDWQMSWWLAYALLSLGVFCSLDNDDIDCTNVFVVIGSFLELMLLEYIFF